MHLLLFLFAALWMSMAPAREAMLADRAQAPVEEETLIFPDDVPPEVTAELEPEPEPEPAPTPELEKTPPKQQYVRTTQNTESPEAPANAAFMSDRNTVASSKLLPEKNGEPGRPTTRGMDEPTLELANREYKDGEIKNDAGTSMSGIPTLPAVTLVPPSTPKAPSPAVAAVPPPPVPVQAVPEVKPAATPPARLDPVMTSPSLDEPRLSLPDIAMKVDSRSEQMVRELEAQLRKADAVDTPPPAPRTPTTALEMRTPLDGAQPGIPQPPLPEGASPSDRSPLVPPVPKSELGAFTPQTRTSATKGTISNIGSEDSVAAAATPVGRYMRQVTSAVEKKWHFYRSREADAVEPGRLSLKFYVNKYGKVEDLKFTMKDANPLMEDFTIEAILKAEIPPIPLDLVPILDRERLEINYDIVIHP
ncbi:hypothetical protein [Verrucomicrobium spinosum]|uniref:hypothetical protein n=2 Tax=Verrucomicrobium TaxID=2735 RepID=UPI0018DEB103|nr:hypothetical protein [Verrucomicrobium spinosum]